MDSAPYVGRSAHVGFPVDLAVDGPWVVVVLYHQRLARARSSGIHVPPDVLQYYDVAGIEHLVVVASFDRG